MKYDGLSMDVFPRWNCSPFIGDFLDYFIKRYLFSEKIETKEVSIKCEFWLTVDYVKFLGHHCLSFQSFKNTNRNFTIITF